jgi:hypothetical protein
MFAAYAAWSAREIELQALATLATLALISTVCRSFPKEPLINLRIVAHCAFDSRATVWTGN